MSFRLKIRALIFLLFVPVVGPAAIYAHPMGNFSISHYSAIRIERGYVEVRYFIDMAEIPTYQEIQRAGIAARDGDPSLAPYLAQEASALGEGLILEIDGKQVELQAVDHSVLFTPGAGDLPTMKLGFVYRAAIENTSSGAARRVHYLDNNFAGHSGWKEIVIVEGDGVLLASSSAPATDRSAQLSNYLTDLLNSPPQDLEATAGFALLQFDSSLKSATNSSAVLPVAPGTVLHAAPRSTSEETATTAHSAASTSNPEVNPQGSGTDRAAVPASPIQLEANQQKTPRSRFTELVTARNLGFWFLFPAALIAAGLGALHALEPGHGKTIVAAYLVGSRGTPRHAVLLGLIVTAAHTAGVYLLGVTTLYASRWIVPEQLYPWLGIISGLMIAGLASYLLLRTWTGEAGDHGHEPGQPHSHWFSSLGRPRSANPASAETHPNKTQPQADRSQGVPLRQLLALGITGGMIPCPAALVVLLSALSLHRVGLGLFLIVAFSLGLAAVLIVIGLLMVYARQFMARWKGDGTAAKRWLPVLSSSFMLILGLGIAGRALLTTRIGANFSLHGHLVSFAGIILLGLFLGMRHSTDPDHVVAVSTIVSRERSVRHAALIGILWGVGHTLTISLVGSAIILFGLVIPPRVGLSMEFSVALMLILLGVLNLTGVLRWVTEKFTPVAKTAENLKSTDGHGELSRNSAILPNQFEKGINRLGLYQLLRPLVVGLVHGLAGSAAVALLVLSTIHDPILAIGYLIIFGVGTIAGMMLMTSAIAFPIAYTGNRFARAGNYIGVASGIASTAFGMFLVYQIGMVDGLFTSQVHWIPR
jgi:ABC-type nickel/cobalt efflux system permease component RcnA